MDPLKICVFGLSITSSWGNGHATTYRGLLRALGARGHKVLFLERDMPWYSQNRDCMHVEGVQIAIYTGREDLTERFRDDVAESDVVVVGSYVPDGVAIGHWVIDTAHGVTAFYDIDTPVTLTKLERNDEEYLSADLIAAYDMYLSFTGGPTLEILENYFGSPMARPLYCAFDPALYYPEDEPLEWDLGYLGTYSADRQPALEELMLKPANAWRNGRFIVAGPQYPSGISWPHNVRRIDHVPPAAHRTFYRSQRFALNITRADMVRMGYSPSVRLFEAAACGTPIISDSWDGLDSFLTPGAEILVARSFHDTLRYLYDMTENERRLVGLKARERVMAHHTAAHRAMEFENYIGERMGSAVKAEV